MFITCYSNNMITTTAKLRLKKSNGSKQFYVTIPKEECEKHDLEVNKAYIIHITEIEANLNSA